MLDIFHNKACGVLFFELALSLLRSSLDVPFSRWPFLDFTRIETSVLNLCPQTYGAN